MILGSSLAGRRAANASVRSQTDRDLGHPASFFMSRKEVVLCKGVEDGKCRGAPNNSTQVSEAGP
jgi:hypothetical protein